MENTNRAITILTRAYEFASVKHEDQRRKGIKKRPYINHPIRVASTLSEIAQVSNIDVLASALLHDTLEDTNTTREEIAQFFSEKIAEIVQEVSDDMKQPYHIRKKKQIEIASTLSFEAKLIKIADKICNILDLIEYPIVWSKKRKLQYILWTKKVVDNCRGVNRNLEDYYEKIFTKALNKINGT